MDKRLEFGLLGPLEMSVDGALVPLGTPKQRAVLAMLLMNRNSPVGVDRLITALWEGWPPSGARASIHSYVSNLRKLLSGAGIDPREVLAAAPPGYRLSIAENTLRSGRFIAEKTAGVHAAAAGRFEQASQHLSAALAQWRGTGARGPARLSSSSTPSPPRSSRRRFSSTPLRRRPKSLADAPSAVITELEVPDRGAPLPRAAVGPADHGLLPHRPPIRRVGRVPPRENDARRRPRHRPRPDPA